MANETSKCELCGEPMPAGEEMFKFHGYSGPCPVPVVIKSMQPDELKALHARWKRAELAWRKCQDSDGQVYEPEGLWEERVEAFEALLAWPEPPQ